MGNATLRMIPKRLLLVVLRSCNAHSLVPVEHALDVLIVIKLQPVDEHLVICPVPSPPHS